MGRHMENQLITVLLKETLSQNGLKSQSITDQTKSPCLQPSSPVKNTTVTDNFDHDNEQGWQIEAVGFGPFWSEYDMWL